MDSRCPECGFYTLTGEGTRCRNHRCNYENPELQKVLDDKRAAALKALEEKEAQQKAEERARCEAARKAREEEEKNRQARAEVDRKRHDQWKQEHLRTEEARLEAQQKAIDADESRSAERVPKAEAARARDAEHLKEINPRTQRF